MDVSALVSGQNNVSYPNPPPKPTATRPTISLPPSTIAEPMSTSCMDAGKIYSLDVVQQPIRARMCGFGDKDRRPITPPPCIRLVVKDATTKKEIDINEIDTSYFVLTVDLCSADAQKEVNLVRHSATSPSISAGTITSYPPPPDDPATYNFPQPCPMQGTFQNASQASVNPFQQVSATYHQHQFPQQTQYPQQTQNMYQQHQQQQQSSQPQSQSIPPIPMSTQSQQNYYSNSATATPITPTGFSSLGQGPLLSPSQLQSCDPRSHPGGMFTRNLIGSLCVSAFKLTNHENQMGVWFILQDLSVRTEGSFRLKMNFVNVGSPEAAQTLNTGSPPVLASCYSDVFHVFSAKKFPGVIESTELSKCFAMQGIKIPIRKDGVRGNERRVGDDDD